MAKLLRLRRGTDTQHTTFTGAEGEVTVNTTNDSLHVHDGSTAGGTELAKADLSNVNGSLSNNLGFADNVRARFGASNDLELFSDGTNGIVNSPTGDLVLSTTGTGDDVIIQAEDDVLIQVQRDTGVETAIHCVGDGTVSLRHNNATKLETTSTGINVTGTVTCDGLTSDGFASINTSSGQLIVKDTNNSGSGAQVTIEGRDSTNAAKWQFGQTTTSNENLRVWNIANASFEVATNNALRFRVQNDGHVVPNDNNSYDLGSSSLQWRDGYFDGTVNCDGLSVGGAGSFSGHITTDGQITVGNGQTSSYINMYDSDNGTRAIHNNSNYIGFLMSNGSWGARCDDNGHWHPGNDNTHDLGSSSLRWRNVYTMDMNLSNEGGSNDVDGTWGSWTIQEGEDDLFLLNRRNGKKYKFNLSEVN